MARRRYSRAGGSRRPWGMAATRWITLLLTGGAVLIFLAIAVDQADRDRRLLGADRTAEATVVQRAGKQMRISFTTHDGRRVIAETDAFSGTRAGDRITVRYHPADPSRYVTDSRSHVWPFVVPLISLVGAGWLALITWRVWRS